MTTRASRPASAASTASAWPGRKSLKPKWVRRAARASGDIDGRAYRRGRRPPSGAPVSPRSGREARAAPSGGGKERAHESPTRPPAVPPRGPDLVRAVRRPVVRRPSRRRRVRRPLGPVDPGPRRLPGPGRWRPRPMSGGAIFVVGVLVTCLVAVACSILWWAAREDGRDDERVRRGLPTDRAAPDA